MNEKDHLPQGAEHTVNKAAERLATNCGVSTEAAEAVVENIGVQALHEQNWEHTRAQEFAQEVSISMVESGGYGGPGYPELDVVGMTADEAMRFSDMGGVWKGLMFKGKIEVPAHVPDEQKGAYKKMAESKILDCMVTGRSGGGGANAAHAYTEAAKESPVLVMGAEDYKESGRISSLQVVRYIDPLGYRSTRVEIVRQFDEHADETGLLIKLVA